MSAAMVAVILGFTWLLLLGAGCYAVAWAVRPGAKC